jgi:hypothetical protein
MNVINDNAYMTMFRADLTTLSRYKNKTITLSSEPRLVKLMLEVLEGHLTIKSISLNDHSIVLIM